MLANRSSKHTLGIMLVMGLVIVFSDAASSYLVVGTPSHIMFSHLNDILAGFCAMILVIDMIKYGRGSVRAVALVSAAITIYKVKIQRAIFMQDALHGLFGVILSLGMGWGTAALIYRFIPVLPTFPTLSIHTALWIGGYVLCFILAFMAGIKMTTMTQKDRKIITNSNRG